MQVDQAPANVTGADGVVERMLSSARRTSTAFEAADGPGTVIWHAWGKGPPVVLLHGGAGSWRHWALNIPALVRAGRQVIAPDLPGLGESSLPPPPFHPARVADIVAAGLRETLPAGSACDLVGFSFGSIVAGLLTAQHPALVRSLTLVGAGGLGVRRADITLESVRDKQGEAREAAHRENLLRLMIADPARIDALALSLQEWNASHARANSVGFAGRPLLRDALQQVNCPLGAIWGEHDQSAGGRLDERIGVLRSLRPGLPVEVIPAAGHWVAFEAPEAFDAALGRMLARHQQTSGPE